MVHDALHQVDLEDFDIVFIENVGNLVCPASFDLGQHRNIVLLSIPEGDDKPAKYPVMFRTADMVMLSKADLLPVLEDFSPGRAEDYLRQLASSAPLIHASAKSGDGLEKWLHWLHETVAAVRLEMEAAPAAHGHHHHHGHETHHPSGHS
jgi:hydrogenase nickel incorporation protein HypB